jgi:hypothetical protein
MTRGLYFSCSPTKILYTFFVYPIPDPSAMTFMYPCIVSINVNYDQQDATILVYLFIPNQLYIFREMSSPIIRSTWQTLFFFGACCKQGRHLYTTTAPSCCLPASYCHLSATLQTTSIIAVNLQDNRAAVFRILIALLSFHLTFPRIFQFSLKL